MPYESVNPNDGKTLKVFEEFIDAELEKSIATAATCVESWRYTSYAERAKVVKRAATLLVEHAEDFARLATLEMGKRIEEARGEVKFSAAILAYYAEHAEAFLAPVKLHPKSVKHTWRRARWACYSASNRGTSPTTNSLVLRGHNSWQAMYW